MELSQKRVGYCRNMARKILNESGALRAPVPVFDIADYYGFRVALLDQPPDKFSGILHKQKKAIGLNKHHHPVRKRFSLAHELGHYFLDHQTADDEMPGEAGIAERDVCESEANEFAAELLVPRSLLKAAIEQIKDIESLRKHFEVSRHVVAIQLSKHGCLMNL